MKKFITFISDIALPINTALVVTMGNAQSEQTKRKHELSLLIHDKSTCISFGVCQKKNVIGHTAIVLIFDYIPRFTIDFGPKHGCEADAAGGKTVPGKVELNYFDDKIMAIKYKIATFELKTEKQRLDIKFLCESLVDMKVEDFEILENNCKDYVIAAYVIVLTFVLFQTKDGNINWQDSKAATKKRKALMEDKNLDECLKFLRKHKEEDDRKLREKNDEKKMKKICDVTLVGGGIGTAATVIGVGGLVFAIPTGGISLIGSSVITAVGLSMAGTGFGIGIPLSMKLREMNQMKKLKAEFINLINLIECDEHVSEKSG